MEKINELVAKHPFFRDLDKKYQELVAGCASNVVFKEDEFILEEGKPANKFFLIREGKVTVEIFSADKGEIIIQTLGKGDILGWSWLFPPYRCHFSARAQIITRVLAFDGKCLRKKCEEDPKLGYELLKRFVYVIAQRLENTRLQLLDVYGMKTKSF